MIWGHWDILGQNFTYEDLLHFKNLYEFCRFFLCDILSPKDADAPESYATLH